MSDSISGILKMMRQQGAVYNPPTMCIGKVIKVEPLQIQVDDLILDREDLIISDFLLGTYQRNIQLALNGTSSINGILTSDTESVAGGSGEALFASHFHGINTSSNIEGDTHLEVEGTITFKDYLKNGDLIILMPTADEQTYIALCKGI